MCGGGKKTYSEWWYFNQLLQCFTTEEIEIQRNRHLGKIGTKALTYINKLEHTSKYPAARCAMTGNIYINGRTTSAGIESMHWANQCAWEQTAVDLVNATMLLVNLENERFVRKRDLAWNSNDILTPKGKLLRDEALKDFNFNTMQ